MIADARGQPCRHTRIAPSVSPRIETRFERLEALTEMTALEIERIAEGQRFTTKLLSERASPSALPATTSDPGRVRTPH